MEKKFTVELHKEGRIFVAKCLELGVASQGYSRKSALKNVKEAVELFIEDNPKAKRVKQCNLATIAIVN
ncbi:MAG: type II toxin-antitoxin system HicB family antitoxin [Candidatus Diapherotrites archaeon]|nr:type II toxin-antitoxin system HicB family antitoxin [Candidatus Diapherotrites archaeon]